MMMKWLVKRFLLGKLNQALDGKDLSAKAATLSRWIERTKLILALLEKAVQALADSKLTEEETTAVKGQLDDIIAKW